MTGVDASLGSNDKNQSVGGIVLLMLVASLHYSNELLPWCLVPVYVNSTENGRLAEGGIG